MNRSLYLLLMGAKALATPAIPADTLPPKSDWRGQVTASYSRILSPELSAPSASLEPAVRYRPGGGPTWMEGYVLVERPIDRYQPFVLPRARFTFAREWVPEEALLLTVLGSATALSIDRWSEDGFRFRPSASLDLAYRLWNDRLRVALRTGFYFQFSKYRHATDGSPLGGYGLFERLDVSFQWARLLFELQFVVDQRYTEVWNNEYASREQITYGLYEGFRLGFAHELVSSLVSDSTGLYQPLNLWPGRNSRLVAVLDWQF